ncbi:unnamed protein product [Closterium sp. NIES-54]
MARRATAKKLPDAATSPYSPSASLVLSTSVLALSIVIGAWLLPRQLWGVDLTSSVSASSTASLLPPSLQPLHIRSNVAIGPQRHAAWRSAHALDCQPHHCHTPHMPRAMFCPQCHVLPSALLFSSQSQSLNTCAVGYSPPEIHHPPPIPPYALCPKPYALCPMPYALCPMPDARCHRVQWVQYGTTPMPPPRPHHLLPSGAALRSPLSFPHTPLAIRAAAVQAFLKEKENNTTFLTSATHLSPFRTSATHLSPFPLPVPYASSLLPFPPPPHYPPPTPLLPPHLLFLPSSPSPPSPPLFPLHSSPSPPPPRLLPLRLLPLPLLLLPSSSSPPPPPLLLLPSSTLFTPSLPFSPASLSEACVVTSAHGAVVGAWIGAWPMPLDWEKPWQAWPICSIYGMLMGFLIGLLLPLIATWLLPPKIVSQLLHYKHHVA